MNNAQRKRRLLISAIAGMIMIPGNAITVQATEEIPEEGLLPLVGGSESVLGQYYKLDDQYLVRTEQGEYLDRAFSNVSDFTYIRTAPDEASDWLGKLYSDSTVAVLESDGDWTKIQSGNVEGYVPADALYTGEAAREREAEYIKINATVTADVLNVRDGQGTDHTILTQILQDQVYPVTGDPVNEWYPVQIGEIDGWVCGEYINIEETYSFAESKAEEEDRLQEEAAAEEEKQQEAIAASTVAAQSSAGQAVIDFACQFIGNPYVWGGTSLTDGADCSGFVQSVYANFGISLPRTSWEMRSAGYEVSYDEALPGDLVLYEGHVGLYMGDGTIVNAMNEEDGIGICTATYAPIVAVRRVL